jgi:hypothetical protein
MIIDYYEHNKAMNKRNYRTRMTRILTDDNRFLNPFKSVVSVSSEFYLLPAYQDYV